MKKNVVVSMDHIVYHCLTIQRIHKICLYENAILADLKSIFDKKKLMGSGYKVFRL